MLKTGLLIALADGAVYAAMVTYMRYEGKTETDNDIAWSMLVGAIVLAPSIFIFGPGKVSAMIAYPALGVELPVLLWAYSLVDIIVSPVDASFLGFLIVGEIPGTGMIVGGALLLGSGFWLSKEMSAT
jgi:drug/metabolite transporter (DMT)-like permease